MDNTYQSCVFCKIVAQAIPAKIIAQNDSLIVIQDIVPKAPIHYLIIPKKHIADLSVLTSDDAQLGAQMFMMAQDLSHDLTGDRSFKFVINNGAGVGQSVFHLHAHFLAGKRMQDL